MSDDSSSDVAVAALDDEDPSVTAVADEPAVTRERAPEVKPGDLLAGRYQIEAVLGKGGSGVVLRAYDRVSAAVVAVKVLKPGLTHDPRWEKRFQRELRLGRPVRHPNVCRIFDIAEADGYRFLTMEYATSGTLRDLIKTNKPLRPLAERLADAAFVIAGLAAIHEAGIVHRDVKPDNVLRMEDGRLVLSDFGLATDLPDSTMVSVFVGTPHYMAPEVREGDPATKRSDVWSLGVVLHEIFFGKRPEKRSNRSVSGVPMRPAPSTSSTVERAMRALCMRCLADDPAERPDDARVVKLLFEGARKSPGALLWARARRKVLGWTAVALAVAALGTVGFRAWRSRGAAVPASGPVPRLIPAGQPADWTTIAAVVGSVPGHVHCFSRVDAETVRLVWGSPRKAEDINIASGVRRPASLVSDAFATGCPDLSPNRRELLFTAITAAGGAEIRHSPNPDGRDAKPVTPGSDPFWMKSGEEFVYSIDGTHAGVFSLPTMRFRLVGNPGLEGMQLLLGKTVSSQVDALALLFYVNDAQWAVTVYDGPGLDRRATYTIPSARNLRFAPDGDRLFVGPLDTRPALAVLDWRTASYRNLGRHAEMDLVDVLIGDQTAALLGRRRTRDVWTSEGGRRRLTNDGDNDAVAISRDGDLLVARPAAGVTDTIWLLPRNGVPRQLTKGPVDTSPDFSPDGRSWIYADYSRKSIVVCASGTNECRVLRRDELLPTWPRYSPDGSKVAYVREGTVSKLVVFSVSDGKEWTLGDTHWQCAPVWSSANHVWAFEGSAGRYAWVEKEVETGLRTGRRVQVAEDQSAVNDELDCWPKHADATSPFFRNVWVETEETSTVLRLPSSALAN